MLLSGKKITQRDIADHMGLSQEAVSKALRDAPDISAALKKKVLETAQKLGYRKNRLARSLVEGKSGLIGVYIPAFSGTFYSGIIDGIESVLSQNNYKMLFSKWNTDPGKFESDINSLIELQAEGLILFPQSPFNEDNNSAQHIAQSGGNVIFVDKEMQNPRLCSINTDALSGFREMLAYLEGMGHQRFLFGSICENKIFMPGIMQRKKYFEKAIAEKKSLRLVHSIIAENNSHFEKQLLAFLHTNSGISCIIGQSDFEAMHIIKILQNNGIRVPQEISITGFHDSLPFADEMSIPLTTLGFSSINFGMKTAEMLMARMHGQKTEKRVLVPMTLHVRKSVEKK